MSCSLLTHPCPLLLLLLGTPLHCVGAAASFWRKSVDASGAIVGAILGTAVFVAAGPLLWLVFAAFVLSSTAFTRFRAREKETFAAMSQKGARRDMFQVVANGGVGMLVALVLRITGEPAFTMAFAASFASANADTWASEIGVLSRREPISLVAFRPVARGTSGGVSLLGTAASVCAALLIAILFALARALATRGVAGLLPRVGCVTAAGVFGSLVDSFLGCTVQARYKTADGHSTERKVTAGVRNTLIRGLPFFTNDCVNFLSTAAAASAGVFFSKFLR